MTPELSSEALQWQAVLNFLTMTLIQWAKTSDWKALSWLNAESPKLTKFVCFVVSAATAQGIHGSFVHEVSGTFTITFTGVTVLAVAHMMKDVIQNYLGIKIMYRLMRPDEWGKNNGSNNTKGVPHPLPDPVPPAPKPPPVTV